MTTRFSSPNWPRTKRSPSESGKRTRGAGARAVFKRLLGAILASAAMFPRPGLLGRSQALKVGVRGGVDEQIWEVVARVAKKNGLAVEPVVITGTASPNEALNNGDLEANSFSTFLPERPDQAARLQAGAGGQYADLAHRLLFEEVQVASGPAARRQGRHPHDPSNQTRALVVLRDQGLITLKDGFDPFTGTATLADVTSNPRKLEFVESASVVLARSLPDVDTAAIVNSFAYQAGLIATRDGIAVEKKENNPYVNIIVVREQDKNAPWVPELVKAYHSEEVRQFILSKYEGSVIPVF